ncbi:helicase-related protein [Aquibacillus albus]|uniref:helicase-related protein n=1 Tax=Aquibacillus albus TaxID=1168171 RepID=UPI003B82C770
MKTTRNEATQQLERSEIDVIFRVDLFNKGIDIPAVDSLLFFRPIESLTVFTRQVGRGLYSGRQFDISFRVSGTVYVFQVILLR